jgi:hypothetical protein
MSSPSGQPSSSSQSARPAPTPLRRRRRGVVISLTVAAAMGLGAGAAAAANEDFRGAAQQIISGIVQTVIPHADPASPQPEHKAPAVHTPAVAPSGAPSQIPAGQPGAAVPSTVPGGAEPSHPSSSQRATSPVQIPELPDRAAHNLPGWLVPPLPPVIPPAVGNDGKTAPVPDPQDPLGGTILGHTPPATPGHN